MNPGFTIGAPNEPLHVHDWHLLLGQARASLARRQEAYPGMVERGQIERDLARRDLEGWQLLVQEWTWLARAEGHAPTGANALAARRAAVELGLARIRQEMDRGNRSHELLRQSHLHAALQWHLENVDAAGDPKAHHVARVNHAMRADQGAHLCGACDRWSSDTATRACTRPDCGLPRDETDAHPSPVAPAQAGAHPPSQKEAA